MSDGMLTRTRRIDSGEPLLLFDPPGADALAVSAAACDNPECPCTRMELSVRRGRRRGDLLELQGDPLRFDVSADGTDLRLTGDTPTAFSPAAAAWLTEQLGDEQHRAWLRERWRRLRGQSGDPAYPSGIPPEHIDGLVPFSDVFPYDFDLTVVEDRKLYWAVDMYCLEPACKCDEVAVQFLDLSVDGGKSAQVGDGRASVRRLHSPTLRGGEQPCPTQDRRLPPRSRVATRRAPAARGRSTSAAAAGSLESRPHPVARRAESPWLGPAIHPATTARPRRPHAAEPH